jgi:glycosyltransferase involved in cell wall biosynthesis
MLLRDNTVCELCITKTLPWEGIKYKCYRGSTAESTLVTAITGLYKLSNTWKKKVGKYIALTEFAKNKLVHSSTKFSPEQVTVIPNFIKDTGVGMPVRENFFLYVGRLSKEKGVHTLIEAFRNLPGYNLRIIGDGPEKENLAQQAEGLSNISFTGNMEKDRVMEAMKQCIALVFPSIWYEGLPLTIIEAYSTGTPVIASRLGAMTEIVADGYNGYHFEAADTTDIAKSITRFMTVDNSALYGNARNTYLTKYHPDIHYNALMKTYSALIKTNIVQHD